jgi:hypothetical protein
MGCEEAGYHNGRPYGGSFSTLSLNGYEGPAVSLSMRAVI